MPGRWHRRKRGGIARRTLSGAAGLESISSGTLSIDGRVVNGVPAKDRDIAMVFQSYALYPHMNVKENLAFGLKRRSVERVSEEARSVAASPQSWTERGGT